MDQLKPILAHKFWILFGLAIIVSIVGWWMASGQLQADIESRRQVVEQLNQKIPPADGKPNEKWIAAAKAVTAEQQKRLQDAAGYLSETQQGLMEWPKELAVLNPRVSELPYRGEIRQYPHGQVYKNSYNQQFAALRELLEPYNSQTQKGKVAVAFNFFQQKADPAEWGNAPASNQMWDAQEDYWLVKAIVQTIAKVNQDAKSISDAPIKEINRISLHGGPFGADGADTTKAKTTKSKIRFGRDEEYDPNEGLEQQKTGQKGGLKATLELDFDPVEEFGAASGRYVEMNSLYRSRGFYLKLAMDHRRLPDLIAELEAMDWPAYVVRVNQKKAAPRTASPPGAIADPGEKPGGGSKIRFGRRAREEDYDPNSSAQTQQQVQETPATVYHQAMANDALADVVIAGVIILYNEVKPQAVASAAQKPAAPAANGTPGTAASPPAATGTQATPAGGAPPAGASTPVGTAGTTPAPGTPPAAAPGSASPPTPASSAPPAGQQPGAPAAPEEKTPSGDSAPGSAAPTPSPSETPGANAPGSAPAEGQNPSNAAGDAASGQPPTTGGTP